MVAVFTAVTAVATASFSVSVPATRGYFNVGETAIYVTALLFGSYVGGMSAGIGSMIADLILGYALYAPATLVVKGLEGAIVGFLGSAEPDVRWSLKYRRLLAIAAAGALALAIFILGSNYYTGLLEFNVGSPLISVEFSLDLPVTFWIALSLITLIAIPYFSLRYDVRLSWQTVTVLIGGAEMVVGYYLYEQLILGAAAIAEVPINFGQMMIGAVVAIPLVRAIRSRVPRIVG